MSGLKRVRRRSTHWTTPTGSYRIACQVPYVGLLLIAVCDGCFVPQRKTENASFCVLSGPARPLEVDNVHCLNSVQMTDLWDIHPLIGALSSKTMIYIIEFGYGEDKELTEFLA